MNNDQTNQSAALARLASLWLNLYGENSRAELEALTAELSRIKTNLKNPALPNEWYKDVVVYSLYVDLFNKDFTGLIEKLDYLHDLGVNCLWLLPILDSPMQDAGFDIRDFKKVRADLLGSNKNEKIFDDFIAAAHGRGIRVIFDIAINHVSKEHPWFVAAKDKNSAYRNYFIWSDTPNTYPQARIIFKGMMNSNWTKFDDQYFMHRFFDVQPDLNYKNPSVLREMVLTLAHWVQRGVDGFRADAIPYLWKEDNTICENLPNTHVIVQIFRAALDSIAPNTMVLAEACQPPSEVVNYFGGGQECHAAYHFPLMPRMYAAMASGDATTIKNTLSESFTPRIPDAAQWFTFLRCHDELTLEMVTPEERKLLHSHYCRDPQWNFREGEGIAARLADLMQHDPKRIGLMNSVLLSLVGTPVIYYGDEVAKTNDEKFYLETVAQTGYKDARYLNRGRMNWQDVNETLANPNSIGATVYANLKHLLAVRAKHLALSRGDLEFVDLANPGVLAFWRKHSSERVLVLANFTNQTQNCNLSLQNPGIDLLGQKIQVHDKNIVLEAYGYRWIGNTAN